MATLRAVGDYEYPSGACSGCGGELTWSRVRHEPGRTTATGRTESGWIGRDPVCLMGLRSVEHPCHQEATRHVAEPPRLVVDLVPSPTERSDSSVSAET